MNHLHILYHTVRLNKITPLISYRDYCCFFLPNLYLHSSFVFLSVCPCPPMIKKFNKSFCNTLVKIFIVERIAKRTLRLTKHTLVYIYLYNSSNQIIANRTQYGTALKRVCHSKRKRINANCK